MTLTGTANFLLLLSNLPVGLYFVILVTRSRWAREYATRAAALASLGLLLVLVQNTLSVYIGTLYAGRQGIRFTVYLGLNIGWWIMVFALLHYLSKRAPLLPRCPTCGQPVSKEIDLLHS